MVNHRQLCCCCLFLLASSFAHAITTGQYEVRVYNGTGFDASYLTLTDGQVIGRASGVPAAITPTVDLSAYLTSSTAASTYVPKTLTINGSALSSNITISTITGNAGTASTLQTPRTINGVSFNGSANITITAAGSTLSDTVPVSKGGTGLTSLGSGVATWMGTPSLANLNAAVSATLLTTGANTFTGTQTTQSIIPSADNTYDLGAFYPGYRFLNLQLSGFANMSYLRLGPGGIYIYPVTLGSLGAFRFTSPNGDLPTALILGPNNSSNVALKPSGTGLVIRLADDSADAPLTSSVITASSSMQVGTRGSAVSAIATVVKVAYNPASIAAGATETTTATITSCADGSSYTASPAKWQGLLITATKTGSNTVTLEFYNPTGSAIDATATDVRVTEIAY